MPHFASDINIIPSSPKLPDDALCELNYKYHSADSKEYAVGYEAALGPPGLGLIAAYIRLDDKEYAACKNKYL